MSYRDRIEQKLTEGLSPRSLIIRDDSHKHAHHGDRIAALSAAGGSAEGHAPIDGQGETHFHVEIVSDRFEGLSRIDRQRLVNDLLKAELTERVHALSLKTKAPSEVP